MRVYESSMTPVLLAQTALEKASENLRAAREKAASAINSNASLQTFYEAREAYKVKLVEYLNTVKEEGEKLPLTVAEMIKANLVYFKEILSKRMDQAKGQ